MRENLPLMGDEEQSVAPRGKRGRRALLSCGVGFFRGECLNLLFCPLLCQLGFSSREERTWVSLINNALSEF